MGLGSELARGGAPASASGPTQRTAKLPTGAIGGG